MCVFMDLTGQRFGKLIVLTRVEKEEGKRVKWNCSCDCGNTSAVIAKDLRNGKTKSCGCGISETTIRNFTKHGQSHEKTSEYITWKAMKQRCGNENSGDWERYGGKGISVCERWKDFKNFFDDMGKKPSPEHSIDRIEVKGNYEPSNCRWATIHEQAINKGINKNNVSGTKGVGWKIESNKWRARITSKGVKVDLGYFENKEDAIQARREAELKYWV